MTNTHWNTPDALGDVATVMIAAPQARKDLWMGQFAVDNRFRVSTIATSAGDFALKVSNPPNVLLVDATIFENPDALLQVFSQVPDTALIYVVLPQLDPQSMTALTNALQQIPPVKRVYHVDINLPEAMETMYGDSRAMLNRQQGFSASSWGVGNPTTVAKPVSTRIISVWNQMGGVGKTTVSSNLAVEAAHRGYPTLLIGMGAPDDLPLIMGLKAQPNITHWQANPTVEGLKLAVQKIATLDVLAGFPDVLSETQATSIPLDDPRGIKSLVSTAIRAGYAVIIIDAPPSSYAAAAIASSNTLVIVGRADLGGVYRTVEALRTVNEKFAGMHNIPANRIHVVVNMVHNHQYDAAEFHKLASNTLGGSFPPIVTAIPYSAEVNIAQNERRLPRADDFRKGLTPLADALFATNGNGHASAAVLKRGKVVKLGPIKVRV